jgi:hypothetical protein
MLNNLECNNYLDIAQGCISDVKALPFASENFIFLL